MRQKGFAPILIILILLGAGVLAYFSFAYKGQANPPQQPTLTPLSSPQTVVKTPTPEPTTPSAVLLPTTGWKTVSAETFSIKLPTDQDPFVSGDDVISRPYSNPNATVGELVASRVGDPITSKPLNLYTGGSRREWWMRANYDSDHLAPPDLKFIEIKLGKVDALEVYYGGGVQTILIANGKNLYAISGTASLKVLETFGYTIVFK